MADALHAHNTLLKNGAGTVLAKVNRINPSLARDNIDTTTHDSLNAWREGLPGLQGMTVAIEGNYIPDDPTHDDSATGILNKFRNGVTESWTVTFPTSPVKIWTLPSFITGIDVDAPVDGSLDFTMQLQLTGEPTFV